MDDPQLGPRTERAAHNDLSVHFQGSLLVSEHQTCMGCVHTYMQAHKIKSINH